MDRLTDPPENTLRVRRYANSLAGTGFLLTTQMATGAQAFALPNKECLLVGRHSDCDVLIDDASVSRHHAHMYLGSSCFIEDLGSTNGTRIAGKQITPRTKVAISPGQVIVLGSVAMVLQPIRRTSIPPPPLVQPCAPPTSDEPVIIDAEMLTVYSFLETLATSPIAILILGETGVGKELAAQRVHKCSERASKPLVQVNCAAIPENLIESELFGHARGAFTGAQTSKQGLIQAAHGGTLFLDEVGDLPLTAQAKLLRVLETGELTRIGEVKLTHVDVRFVSATNQDLPTMISQQLFRADLFYRLNGATVSIPPLRERASEIVPLARFFLARFAAQQGRQPPTISEAASQRLLAYQWPGNVRELRNIMQRTVALCKADVIEVDDLRFDVPHSWPGPGCIPKAPQIPRIEHPPNFEPPAWPDERATQAMRAPSPVVCETSPKRESSGALDSNLRDDSPTQRVSTSENEASTELKDAMQRYEREEIVTALRQTGGNQTRAAMLLGISRRTLTNKLGQYDIDRPRRK